MKIRKIVAVVLGLAIAAFAIYLFFPRLQNDFSCEDTQPASAAQGLADRDARARSAAACAAASGQCQFRILTEPDGSILIRRDVVKEDFSKGCISLGHAHVSLKYFYTAEGQFIREEVWYS